MPYHQGPSLGGYQHQQQKSGPELPKNSNWAEPIDRSRIFMFRDQYIPANFDMDNQAADYQTLLSEMEAIKEKAKVDAGGEWPSRLHQLMETLLKSSPEVRHQIGQALDSVYISNY